MKTLLSGIALSLFALTANAGLAVDVCGANCHTGPQPTPGLTFEAAQKLYASGRQPLIQDLLGQWRFVAQAVEPSAKRHWANVPSNSREFNDHAGQKNADGSALRTLQFAEVYSDWEERSSATITILNLGSRTTHQGPYQTSFKNEAVCFSHYTYTFFDELGKSYFASACKLVGSTNARLLCEVTLHIAPEEISPDDKSYNGKVVFYKGFLKN